MDSTRTITELKSAFIWSQVRIFSESLDLPEDWRNYAAETTQGDLSDKVIEDVLHKGQSRNLNHTAQLYMALYSYMAMNIILIVI
jgi:hypothetical protein